MSAASLIARRYLFATSRSSFFSWMTALAISGISIGLAAMIVVISVINGFENEFRGRFLAANAHILAFRYPAAGINDIDAWSKLIHEDFGREITGVSPFVQAETLATKDGLMHNILIRGIHPTLRKTVQDPSSIINPNNALELLAKSQSNPHPSEGPIPIIIGSGLLSILQTKVGETIKILTPTNSTSLGTLRDFLVVGVYDSGLKHYDNKLGVLAIKDAQDVFQLKGKAHGFEIGLKNPMNSKAFVGFR
jgi:lipoprotein-releasing system permease protein